MPRRVLCVLAVLGALCGLARAADPAGVWIDVPFVAQQGEGCGAASLAMVMQYWEQKLGRAATASSDYAQIERALYSPGAHGIYASAMEHYLRGNGYRTFAFAGTLGDLAEHVAKGRPLIVALEPGKGEPLHYVVVAGVDPARQTVLVNDPAQRKLLAEDTARFEREWKAAGSWTLLAVPEGQ